MLLRVLGKPVWRGKGMTPRRGWYRGGEGDNASYYASTLWATSMKGQSRLKIWSSHAPIMISDARFLRSK